MNPSPAPVVGRQSHLDVLRAIAVLLVLARHHRATGFLHDIGWIGVDPFFVLSGFLVAGLLFKEHRSSGMLHIGRFLLRRSLKIHPLFYLVLALTVLERALFGWDEPLIGYMVEVLFLQSYFEGVWSHTWSLAVEEHFYLLLALVAFASVRWWPRMRFRTFLVLCGGAAILCLAGRVCTTMLLPFDEHTHLFATHARLDALLCGVVLAAWFHYRTASFKHFFRRGLAWKSGIAVLLVAPVFFLDVRSAFITSIGFTIIYLSGAWWVGLAATADGASNARHMQWLILLGRSSYAIYLVHLLMLDAARWFSGPIWKLGGLGECAFYFATSLGAGITLTQLVERPILRWRDKVLPAVRVGRD